MLPPDPGATLERVRAARREQRLWVAGLFGLGVVVVVLAGVTIGVSVTHNSGGRSATSTSSPSSRSGTTTTGPSGPGPHITSLSPSQGPAGQSVSITGTNLVSANGQVLAKFGGQVAPTSCSSATTCSATAPSSPSGSNHVPVTVTTSAGTSNSLNYTYQS